MTKYLDFLRTGFRLHSPSYAQHPVEKPGTEQALEKHMLNELTTDATEDKCSRGGPGLKASHHVNHAEDKMQGKRELQASGESHEEPGV